MIIERRLQIRWPVFLARGLLAIAAPFALAGCGGEREIPRFELTGTVTYDGQLVPAGYIEFAPDGEQGNSGPGTSAEIHEGRYATLPGRGTIGGPHIATLRGFDGQKSPTPAGAGSPIQQSAGNALFTTKVSLDLPKQKGVHDFEIPKQ